jgi:antirestriction protein
MARIYAACLASYNNGVLHGRWIEASSDVDEMQKEVSAMLRESRFPNVTVTHPETGEQVPSAEEWAMHDSEGLPSRLGEYCGLAAVAEFVELVEEFDHIEPEDMATIVDHFGQLDWARTALEDRYCGVYESLGAYAEDIADELLSELDSEHIARRYFDYLSFTRDMDHQYDVVELSEGVAIFNQ